MSYEKIGLLTTSVCGVLFLCHVPALAEDGTELEIFYYKGKYGFIDASGRVVIEPVWDKVNDFSEGFAVVKGGDYQRGYKYGFIDTSGKVVFMVTNAYVYDFHEGLARFRYNTKDSYGITGFVDKTFNVVIEPIFSDATNFSEGYSLIAKKGKVGLIDIAGRVVIEPIWDSFDKWYVQEHSADLVAKFGWWQIIEKNEKGEFNYEPVFSGTVFSDGLARVKSEGKWGFIDSTGAVIIEPQWEDVAAFSEGFARISSYGRWGFTDKIGKIISEPQWDGATDFIEGFARVRRGAKWEYIDTTGIIVEPPTTKPVDSSSQGTEKKTKRCLICGAPIYEDEVFCDKCLFGD